MREKLGREDQLSGWALHPQAPAEAFAARIHGCLASLGWKGMVLHELHPVAGICLSMYNS